MAGDTIDHGLDFAPSGHSSDVAVLAAKPETFCNLQWRVVWINALVSGVGDHIGRDLVAGSGIQAGVLAEVVGERRHDLPPRCSR